MSVLLTWGMDTIHARIRHARKAAGLTQEAIAEALSLSRVSVTLWEKEGGTRPDTDRLAALADLLNTTVDWIIDGRGDPPHQHGKKRSLISSFDPDQPDHDYTPDAQRLKSSIGRGHKLTPGAIVEVEVRAGAGGGGYVTQGTVSDGRATYSADVVRAEWILPPSFVRDELHLTFGRTEIIAIRGDSMEPDLRDGDRVLIDRTDINLRQGGIFAVSDSGEIIVKQVELIRDSDPPQILCSSRNDRYRPITLTLDDGTFIIGRVAARISRM